MFVNRLVALLQLCKVKFLTCHKFIQPLNSRSGVVAPSCPPALHGLTKLKFGPALKGVAWLNDWVKNGLKLCSVCPALDYCNALFTGLFRKID